MRALITPLALLGFVLLTTVVAVVGMSFYSKKSLNGRPLFLRRRLNWG